MKIDRVIRGSSTVKNYSRRRVSNYYESCTEENAIRCHSKACRVDYAKDIVHIQLLSVLKYTAPKFSAAQVLP